MTTPPTENPLIERTLFVLASAVNWDHTLSAAASVFFHVGLECAVYEPDRARLVLAALQEYVTAHGAKRTLAESQAADAAEATRLLDVIFTEEAPDADD